jgi:hypothetical protein
MAIFHPDLEYTQPDGRKIGWAQVARDVQSQLAMFRAVASEFIRESLD